MAKTVTKRREKAKPAEPAGGLGPHMLRRVIVEGVLPQVDSGRFPIKRTVGEEVVVTADIFKRKERGG
jgi:hypothetical protein